MSTSSRYCGTTGRLPLVAAILCSISALANGAVLQVGPGKPYAAPCAAIAAAANGDTIEIDPGLYLGDVCAWNKNDLTIRGVNGRPHINANGRYVQSKGIWVAGGRNLTVENIEFSGAALPSNIGTNGAAIRAEATNWTVRNCYFHDNQNSILESNVAASNILIEYTEFERNGYSNGQSHNLYIGHAASLTYRYNYSHDSIVGHLLKTRAAVNAILYNRLTGEVGTGSYEIDVPNGGTTYIIGNIIQQGPATQNSTIMAYMAEGPHGQNPGHDLYVVNNTIVNQRPNGGTFIRVDSRATVPAVIINNLLAGPTGGSGAYINAVNPIVLSNRTFSDPAQAGFAAYANFDYHLVAGSAAINAGSPPGIASNGTPLDPVSQYVHPAKGEPRSISEVIDVGAYEFHDVTAPVITPAITGPLGASGWYIGDVTVTWSVSDLETGIASSTGCETTVINADTAGVTLTCSAVNREGLSNSSSVSVKLDKTAPVISGMPGAACSLWPPNHQMVEVATVTAWDALSGLVPASFQVTGASNERSQPKSPDVVITPAVSGGFVVQLRAERTGSGGDRIYTLTATAADAAGNTATTVGACTVPHDQGN
jgi:hypothetical protein